MIFSKSLSLQLTLMVSYYANAMYLSHLKHSSCSAFSSKNKHDSIDSMVSNIGPQQAIGSQDCGQSKYHYKSIIAKPLDDTLRLKPNLIFRIRVLPPKHPTNGSSHCLYRLISLESPQALILTQYFAEQIGKLSKMQNILTKNIKLAIKGGVVHLPQVSMLFCKQCLQFSCI